MCVPSILRPMSLSLRFAREFLVSAPPQLVDDDPLWQQLRQCEDVSVLAALQQFGELLLSEVQSRTATLEAKAISLLGWNSAAAALFLTALPQLLVNSAPRWVMVIGALTSGAGAITAFASLRVQAFRVPSQQDWLDLERLPDETRVRRAHVIALRRWHETDSEVARWKAVWARWAQLLLVSTAMVLTTSLLLALFPARDV